MENLKLDDLSEELENLEFKNIVKTEMNETAYEIKSLSIEKSDIVRIEESVYFSWGGVTGCNTQERADGEYSKVLKSWVKNKMYEHRNWRWVRYGTNGVSGTCNSFRDRWTNVRSCGCRGHLKCYIEFRKP
ncbi:MAG: hypothetical protein QM503_03060 [Bacteroidota bacterium]